MARRGFKALTRDEMVALIARFAASKSPDGTNFVQDFPVFLDDYRNKKQTGSIPEWFEDLREFYREERKKMA